MLTDILLFFVKVFAVLAAISFISLLIRGWIPSKVIGRWHHTAKDFNHSTNDFYMLLKTKIKTHDHEIDVQMVELFEGVMFISKKRYYLRIMWREKVLDVCAAPFGEDYFFSWWLYEKDLFWKQIISNMPYIGERLANFLDPITYYRVDTALMLQNTVHRIITEQIEAITKESGHSLSSDDKKPQMQDLFKR